MIECRSLTKYYGETTAADGIDLTLRVGEVVGLFGVNGAGKSTLLRLAAGLIEPTSGEVTIDGCPPRHMREAVSCVAEAGGLFGGMTPAGHRAFFERFYPAFDRERFEKLIDFFELPDRPAYTLSRGQQAKLAAAVGFSKGARYLLWDEPFLGKDIFTRRDFIRLAASMLDGKETLVIASHEVGELEAFLDRAVILSGGRVKADFSLDELHESGGTLEERFAKVSGYDPDRVGRFADSP